MRTRTNQSVGGEGLRAGLTPKSSRPRIFLLSPANASSLRGNLLLGESGRSLLAQRLRNEGATLGEIFTFISGLYFRGELAYAQAYAGPPPGVPGVLVITASGGLVSPDKIFRLPELRQIRSEEHTSELQSHVNLVCRLLLEKKK